MPPRKQKQNQSDNNVNQEPEARNEQPMSTRSSRRQNLPSDDEIEENDIFKGFSVQKDTKPIILNLPFTVQPSVTIDDFYNTLLPACDAILQIHHNEGENQIEFSHIHRRMAQAISKTPQIMIAYESLCQHIQSFCNDLPHQISSYCENAESIGIFWNSIEDKINKIMILFDSLSYKSKTIPEIFSQYCSEAFKSNIEYFKQASQLIIDAYNEYRETKQKPPIDSSIQFLKETGLFNDFFIPLLIDSVIKYIEPHVNESFELCPFSEYLETVTQISENELELATIFSDYSLTLQLTDQINKLIFSSKMDQIYEKCLRPLLKDQEIDSIWTCSKLARSTDAFNPFIHVMAQLFEEEATSCFVNNSNEDGNSTENTEIQDENSNDPIDKLLHLYKSLTLFCSRACGPQSTRTVKLAFERGFNSEPETVARLLALSVNKLFTGKLQLIKSKQQKEQEKEHKEQDEDNENFDYEIIDQYFGLFRMLTLNDVFETYHTLLLTRRILTMKDRMVAPETFFIEKLKQQCGDQYTCRMEQLFTDRTVSKKLLNRFVKKNKQLLEQKQNDTQNKQRSKSSQKSSKNNDVDVDTINESSLDSFRCLIISAQTAQNWASLKTVKFALPYEISLVLSKFENYYKSNMNERRVSWNLQLSTVKLKVLNIQGLDKIKCSGDFAIILMAFNNDNFENRIKELKRKLKEIEMKKEEKEKEEEKKDSKNDKKNQKKNDKRPNLRKTSSNSKKKANISKLKKSRTATLNSSSDNDEYESSSVNSDADDETLSTENDDIEETSDEEETKTKVTKNKVKSSNNNQDSDDENKNENNSDEDEKSEMDEADIHNKIKEIENEIRKKWNCSLTFSQLKLIVDGKDEEITSRLRILKSKKFNKLLIEEKNDSNKECNYKINSKCDTPNGMIVLPFIFPQLAEKEEETIETARVNDRNYKLDAAIVSILKADKSIEKDFLYNKVLNIFEKRSQNLDLKVRFKVNREFFEERLNNLEYKDYCKIDPAGKVHYVNA